MTAVYRIEKHTTHGVVTCIVIRVPELDVYVSVSRDDEGSVHVLADDRKERAHHVILGEVVPDE